jgi:hypothetical protein
MIGVESKGAWELVESYKLKVSGNGANNDE